MKIMHLVSALSLLAPAAAFADDGESLEAHGGFDHHVAAPANALELSVGTGYAQGAGPVGGGMQHLEDISGPGGAFEIAAGYRISPLLAVGAYGTFSKYQSGDNIQSNTDVIGATAGI